MLRANPKLAIRSGGVHKKNINRIRLCIDTDNKGSRRVAEKNGYKHEGTQRGAFYHRGRHHDMELYAILKEEALSS